MSIRRKIRHLPRSIRDAFSSLPKTNICLWHAGRCGSTVLASLIDEDGRLNWKGEFLEHISKDVELRGGDAEKSWEKGIAEIRAEVANKDRLPLGIEMKLWHLVRFRKTVNEAYQAISSTSFDTHIILERKNYLRVYLSGQILHASGTSHIKDEKEVYRKKVTIDVPDLLNEIEICHDFYRSLKDNLPSGSLYLSYEDDISDSPDKAYSKLMNNIGLSPRKTTTNLKKTNARPASEMVNNWTEITDAIQRTQHNWMLAECS